MFEERVNIELPVDNVGGKRAFESVPALRIGGNRYRILGSPGFAPGVAAGDEVELDPLDAVKFRVVKRGGNVCVQLFLRSCSPHDRDEIANLLAGIGGRLDGGLDGQSGALLIFTVPVSAGFASIENAMDRVSARFAVDKWMYGNVFDIADGVTPLNWWNKTT